MKTRTDLKAGIINGQCHEVYDKFGRCKKISCPYPPYDFPCAQKYRASRYGWNYQDVAGEEQ
jgi:hypothetical protein